MFDPGLTDFEAFDEALDAIVDVNPMELSSGQIHRTLVELLKQQSKLQAVTLRFAASWEASGLWAENGSRSPEARLARDAKLRRSTVAQTLRRAKALASMPLTAAALAEGAITTDHVDVLMIANAQTRWRCTRFAGDEAILVGYCRQMSFFHAERAIRNWCNVVDAALGDDGPEPTHRDRELSWHRGINGDIHLKGILDAIGGGEFIAALELIEHELYLEDKRSGSDRTIPQRRADALVEMARRSRAMPADAKKPQPLITVLMGEQSFRWLCELTDGTIVRPNAIVPYTDITDVEAILFDGPFYGVGVSSQRTFTGVLRKIIQARDRHCQHPSGCDEPITRCDVDHILPYSEGGITEQEDGRLQCRPHNRNADLHNRGPDNVTIFDDDPTAMPPPEPLDVALRRLQASPAASAADSN